MTAVRRRLRFPLVALLLASLTGCATGTERYCDTLGEKKETLTDLAGGGSREGDVLAATLDTFRELRDEAPGDIVDEWSTLVFAYEALAEAFEAAGVSAQEYDPASPGPDVTEEQARRIEGAAAKLRTPRVMRAAEDVEQHARDVCKVDLGLSPG
jgi:hypothetical protein